MGRIREYLKLSRISIASLTSLAPVMGGVSTGHSQTSSLLLLFVIGFFGHAYGMAQNDVVDYKVDARSSAISDRPLVSGTISLRHARFFALGCLCVMVVVAIGLAMFTSHYLSLVLLLVPIAGVTLYNILGKKVPFADMFLVVGMFFFIFYGASLQVPSIEKLPGLTWVICALGAIEMLFINVIQGGFKDVENDERQGARTGVMTLGLRISEAKVSAARFFLGTAYVLQVLIIGIALLPTILILEPTSPMTLNYLIFASILGIGISTLFITHTTLASRSFDRGRIRMLFNLQGYLNFMLAPVLLASVTLYALLLIPIPMVGFAFSSLLYEEKFMQPASM